MGRPQVEEFFEIIKVEGLEAEVDLKALISFGDIKLVVYWAALQCFLSMGQCLFDSLSQLPKHIQSPVSLDNSIYAGVRHVHVKAMHRSGGKCLFWNESVRILTTLQTAFTIEAKIGGRELQDEWWFIGVYASCDDHIRKQQWKVLKERKRLWGEKFVIAGDFNDIISNEEKWGGIQREEKSFMTFKDFIAENGLVDLGYEGHPWTWSNHWDNTGEVRQRLDRCLSSCEWSQKFEGTGCKHIESYASDHSLLLLDSEPDNKRKKKRFYFDKRWFQKDGIQQVIEKAWSKEEQGTKMFRVTRKVRNCRVEILKWKNTFQANSKVSIKDIKSKLESNERSNLENKGVIRTDLKEQLKKAFREEESFWSQKARVQWLREGAKNSRFFHASVRGRRNRNRISSIQRDDGSWTKNEEDLVNEMTMFYKNLFARGNVGDSSEVLRGIAHTITEEMNFNLTKPVHEEEIRSAIFSMNPDKAPGVDGMTPPVLSKILECDPKGCNPGSLRFLCVWPISLCSMLYKIISKILANRLKPVLDKCISKNQSAFIPDRQILDNVIIAQEYMQYLKNKRLGEEGYMAIKLDMAKAYDRVEWHFLKAMMLKMGFCAKWVHWISRCMETVSYSFNCNGEVKGFVKPGRGIRQGDPLSPYLFLICSEGFSNLLQRSTEDRSLKGVKISRQGPSITHLFFADDSLIFCGADKQ
nr:uncharacterized protein LOC113741027 [Coffea arabica]